MHRIFQIITSLVLFIITLPLVLLMMVLLWFEVRDVFFVQKRLGQNMRDFYVFKFRTIHPKTGNIGFFGKWIRILGLDELPQLLNILRGEMNYVGPRPLLENARDVIKDQSLEIRNSVKPGLTGWAQIHGRNSISWQEKFSRDIWYVQNQSLFLDIKILMLTIVKLLRAPWNDMSVHIEHHKPV